jgi:DNA-directed RNA polymerase subunit beta
VARLRVRREGPRLRPHRPPAQAAGDDAAARLGLDQETILGTFYGEVSFTRAGQGWKSPFRPERLKGQKLTTDLVDASTGQTLAEAGTKINPRLLKKLEEQGLTEVYYSAEDLVGRFVSRDLINEETGLVHVEAGGELTGEMTKRLVEAGVVEIPVLDIDHLSVGPYIRSTLVLDRCASREDALLDIYRVLRPGEPPTLETAETLFNGLIFDSERYDLSPSAA